MKRSSHSIMYFKTAFPIGVRIKKMENRSCSSCFYFITPLSPNINRQHYDYWSNKFKPKNTATIDITSYNNFHSNEYLIYP